MDSWLLGKHGISHVLTVDTCPLPPYKMSGPPVRTKFIQATDLPYEDLLSHFQDTFEFINEGQSTGGVLVHCYFGVSRSATVVAAFLMKKYAITFDSAICRLKESRKLVAPNRGFESQLRLYETLGYTIDRHNLQFKMFRLRVTANKVSKAKMVPQDCMNVVKPDPSIQRVTPDPRVYRCRKCRRIVASASNILPHVKGEKASWKDPKWSADLSGLNLCSDMYFMEPVAWIPSVSQSQDGKIICPKCNCKLGSFSWIQEKFGFEHNFKTN